MPDQDDIDAIEQSIADGVQKPASATVDGNSVSQVSVKDKILAADRAGAQQTTDARQFFFHRTRMIPGPRQ
jgi:hypothetical protein